jgi:hypothetical protein
LWYIGESINNNFTGGFTDGESTPKKIYPLHSIDISITEYNISPTEKSYVIPRVNFFYVGIFFGEANK